ncbi:MAG: transcriptional regulator NrdR [Pseudomonadota bacterium]
MKCPFCGYTDTQVLESRTPAEATQIRRRRRCLSCHRRFLTIETAVITLPHIIKQDGTRQAFDVEKIRRGFERALHKRPVSATEIDNAIDDILQCSLNSGERELSAEQLGNWVMQHLHRLDQVAYIRFASVYRRFEHAVDFQHMLTELEHPASPSETEHDSPTL